MCTKESGRHNPKSFVSLQMCNIYHAIIIKEANMSFTLFENQPKIVKILTMKDFLKFEFFREVIIFLNFMIFEFSRQKLEIFFSLICGVKTN